MILPAYFSGLVFLILLQQSIVDSIDNQERDLSETYLYRGYFRLCSSTEEIQNCCLNFAYFVRNNGRNDWGTIIKTLNKPNKLIQCIV